MTASTKPGESTIFLLMAVFVLLGIPLIAVLWESLNHLLALETGDSLLLAIPAVVLLVVLLFLLKRSLGRRLGGTE